MTLDFYIILVLKFAIINEACRSSVSRGPGTLRSCAVDDMLRMIMIHRETLYYDHTKPLMLKFSSYC